MFSIRVDKFIILLTFILCTLLSSSVFAQEYEANGTPSPEDQRKQLTQLTEMIRNAPDPQAALQEAAQASHMEADQLLSLLERNYKEMQQAAKSPPVVLRLFRLLTTTCVVASQWTRKHPRPAGLLLTTGMVVAYIAHTAPRTGTILSNRRSWMSKGPTTLYRPPRAFVRDKLLLPTAEEDGAVALSPTLASWTEEDWKTEIRHLEPWLNKGDTVAWLSKKNLPPESKLQQARLSQVTVRRSSVFPKTKVNDRDEDDFEDEDDDDDEDDSEDDDEMNNEIRGMAWAQAAAILRNRQLSEHYSESAWLVASPSSEQQPHPQHAVIVIRGMGDWNRFGWLGLTVTEEQLNTDDDNQLSLSMSTWAQSHFDGQIYVSITRPAEDDDDVDDDLLVVGVYIMVPKGGHSIVGESNFCIADSLARSIAHSIETRTQQQLARREQAAAFSQHAKQKAQNRRKSRLDKEVSMEEMATDRRRRWQRANPNSGHYRPSGDRQRSPNNAMYK